jgi:hypothetical protein
VLRRSKILPQRRQFAEKFANRLGFYRSMQRDSLARPKSANIHAALLQSQSLDGTNRAVQKKSEPESAFKIA